MHHVLKQPHHGYLPIYFDLEDVDSPHELVWRVVREVLAQDRLRSFLQSARGLPGVITSWVRDTFDEVEFDLECDWYVVLDPTTNEYHFLLSVMRDWWRRWHGARRRTARRESKS